MLSWFRVPPKCPVDEPTREWIEYRSQWIVEQFGRDMLLAQKVVLPRPQFFPDAYCGLPEDALPMFHRVCEYMRVPPGAVELHFYSEQGPLSHLEGKHDGSAGLYVEGEQGFQIWLEVSNLEDPLALAATMAHELAHVHLLGWGRVSREEEDHEMLADLLTVFLGLGVLTANSVLQQRSWQQGEYASWSMKRSGYLTMPMYGYALALFAQLHGETSPPWRKELRTDVLASYKQGMRYLIAREQGQR